MTNKIAIITGASRGLGKSIALHLAAQGVHIIGTYQRQQADAQSVQAEIEALGGKAQMLQLDIGDSQAFSGFVGNVDEALKALGASRFDYLVNNAGIGLYNSVTDTTEEQFDQLMNIHFKGPYFLTQKLLPLMNDGGSIVNISTGLARFSLPGFSAYASMKGAVEVWTRYLAKELGPRKITVNTLAPGAIETDFGGGRTRDDAAMNQHIAEITALGRAGLPDDIGAAVSMLLGDGGRWITGQRIEASGGMFL